MSNNPSDTVVTTHAVDWRSIFAGALAAAAIGALLFAFGSALGLSLTSARPYSGIGATGLSILAAIWFCLVNVIAFAVGGYVAGRMRVPMTEVVDGEKGRSRSSVGVERNFRDGAHGLLVWAVGTLLAAYLVAGAGSAGLSKVVDAGAEVAKAATTTVAGAVSSDAGGILADRLLRPRTSATPGTAVPPRSAGSNDVRPELTRLLAETVVSGTLAGDDRTYVARVVAANTGLTEQEAAVRVDEVIAAANKARDAAVQKARDAAEVARKSAILAALLAAAVSLLGLVAAVWASTSGGVDRDRARQLTLFGQPVW